MKVNVRGVTTLSKTWPSEATRKHRSRWSMKKKIWPSGTLPRDVFSEYRIPRLQSTVTGLQCHTRALQRSHDGSGGGTPMSALLRSLASEHRYRVLYFVAITEWQKPRSETNRCLLQRRGQHSVRRSFGNHLAAASRCVKETLDYRNEEGRFPVSTSRVTI